MTAVVLALALIAAARPALAEDAKVEASAQEAIARAEQDFTSKALGKALYRLGRALRACGKSRCTDATVAALARDAGAVHVRQRDKKGGAKLFARAIGLVPDLELSAAYDAPDVRAVWEEAGGGKKAQPPPPVAVAPESPAPPVDQHPSEEPIRGAVAGEAPRQAGQPAPDVSPQAAVTAPAPVDRAPEPAAEPSARSARRLRRLWVGVAGSIDFMEVPSGDDLCVRNAATGRPTNGNNLYCTTHDGNDFPPTSVINGTLGDIVPGQGQGGHSDGGLQLGDVRYLATIDYAVTNNALIGARLGLVTNQYQGHDAVRDNRAFGARVLGLPIHLELRATWVFGHEPLIGTHLAPVVFVAGGVSEFDAQVKSNVTITQGTPPTQTSLGVPVNIWRTDGPGFVGAGVGLRWTVGGVFAVTPAVRGTVAFGDNGLLPLFGPELTLQIGF